MPHVSLVLWICVFLSCTPLLAQEPLSLDECIDIALKNNQKRAMSKNGMQVAKAQLGQARSAYWPQLNTHALFLRLDEAPVFIFPEETDIYSIGGVLPQPISTEVTIPEKELKLLEKNLFKASATLTLPLYTGGLRSGLMQQAKAGVELAHQNTRQTDQEIVYQIRRLYYGAILADKLAQIAQETHDRLTVTLELTENLYKNGSGKVMKTDYLKNKIFVESVKGIHVRLQDKANNAYAGLIFYLGLSWETKISLSETEIPFQEAMPALNQMVEGTMRFNPNWLSLQAGLNAFDGKIKEAKSETRPRLALIGNLEYINNSYDKGIVAPQNKQGWQIGLGLELPLFNGFRTRHKVREMKARLTQLEHQEILLKEGLATQTKVLFQKLQTAQQHTKSAQEAFIAAKENRELTELGYQADMLDTQDVIESQLTEAVIEAQYHITRYDHYQTRIQIEKLIGAEIEHLINE